MHDAIVVGGGVSGIAAAVQLHAAGADVVLLEARGRLGGRVATAAVGGVAVERGGEFLDAAPDGALLPLLERLGVATAPASQDGAGHRTGTLGVGLVDVGGIRRHGRDLPAAAVDPIAALERDLDDLAARIDPIAPWELDGAGALDATSLADRLAEHGADSRWAGRRRGAPGHRRLDRADRRDVAPGDGGEAGAPRPARRPPLAPARRRGHGARRCGALARSATACNCTLR